MWECNTPETCPELSACSPQTSVCTVKWSPAIVVAAAAAETDLRTQEGTRTFETYHIAFNFQGAQFSCFSRIWGGGRKIYAPRKKFQNCYKLLLEALGGLSQAPLAFCLWKVLELKGVRAHTRNCENYFVKLFSML